MKISECSFCGVLAITDQDICASCRAFTSPENQSATAQNPSQTEANAFHQAPRTAFNPAYPATVSAPANEYAPPFQAPPAPRGNSYQPPPVIEGRCLRCQTPVPRGTPKCSDCANGKKSSPLKLLVVFTIIAVVVGFFSFDYIYTQVSPRGVFRKYEKTTGADNSLIFENFTLKGDTNVSVSSGPSYTTAGFSDRNAVGAKFSFKMVFKKPNKSSIEFISDTDTGSVTAFKQAFDGVRGWKFTNMMNQPAGYQDTDDGFASKKLGLGMDEYDSLEFLNDKIAEEYGKENIKTLTAIEALEVADLKKPSEGKIVVLANQKINGKIDSSLLVFDRSSGLLVGMIKKTMVREMPLFTFIYFNKYAKFPVKRSGYFGVEETRILVPTAMSFVTRANNSGQVNSMPVVTIELAVKNVEFDAAIEDSYFQRQE
ncbi:MAG TPA: hypothetical protein VGC97_07315 [Pyrinomonadaceae bacterium]|jgi:hypothetical protein